MPGKNVQRTWEVQFKKLFQRRGEGLRRKDQLEIVELYKAWGFGLKPLADAYETDTRKVRQILLQHDVCIRKPSSAQAPTVCKRGHALSGDNVVFIKKVEGGTVRTWRWCKACGRLRNKENAEYHKHYRKTHKAKLYAKYRKRYSEHRDAYLTQMRKRQRADTEAMGDSYVAFLLGLNLQSAPKELLEAKRAQLKLHRLLTRKESTT